MKIKVYFSIILKRHPALVESSSPRLPFKLGDPRPFNLAWSGDASTGCG